MIVAVTGGRNFHLDEHASEWLEGKLKKLGATRLIHGGCRGADLEAARVAYRMGIPTKEYKAEWSKHGRAAGPIRNAEMARLADHLIAFPGGHGTQNMVNLCGANDVPITRYIDWKEVKTNDPNP